VDLGAGCDLFLTQGDDAPGAAQVLGEYFGDEWGSRSLIASVLVTVVVHEGFRLLMPRPRGVPPPPGPFVVWTPATLTYSATGRNGFASRFAKPS